MLVAEIESRAAPLEDKTDDPLRYRVRSSSGFLAPEESFLSRLKLDSETVLSLHVTHEHLAEQLESLLRQAADIRKALGKGPDTPVLVAFEYRSHPNESIVTKPQHLVVSRRSYMGAQWSFFRNLTNESNPSPEDTLSWKEDHEIYNEQYPDIVLHIAGGIATGICHYIGRYGFYEGGGDSNPYRVDPALLHRVLSGK